MCGIAGIFALNSKPVDRAVLARMTDAIAHRGPDDHDLWISDDGRAGFGHRRLSIIDLSPLGRQPMTSPSGRYVVTYNGEIYNYRALRRKLEEAGVRFRGHSDTEVMLAGFERWGIEGAIGRMAGMFVFGLWDRDTGSLWLGRDRLGIKPLYYAAGAQLVFGSELRALTAHPDVSRTVSRHALGEFLRYGYVPGPLGIFEGVHKLPPGCLLAFRPGKEPEMRRYWDIEAVARDGRQAPFAGDEAEATEALDRLLRQVVDEHMISDVPLGALLSGGIDSSTVLAVMQATSRAPIHSFSIGFGEREWNEAPYAAAVARHLGADHTELYVSDRDAREVIPALPGIYDEPFADSSQIPTYLVSKLARRAVTVVLSGDGGDETFGGYNRYLFVSRFWQRLRRIPAPLRQTAAGALSMLSPAAWNRVFAGLGPILPSRLLPSLPGEKVGKVAAVLAARDIAGVYRSLVAQWANPEQAMINGRRDDPASELSLPEADDVSRQMCHDTRTYLVDDILTKVDRASMAVSLEARVPLLDHRVTEFAWRLPIAWKVRDGEGKRILRRVLARYVPEILTARPKMGFGVPIAAWLREPLKDWAEDCLGESRLRREGFFDAKVVRQAWQAHLSGRADRSGPLWAVLMFQCWLARYGA